MTGFVVKDHILEHFPNIKNIIFFSIFQNFFLCSYVNFKWTYSCIILQILWKRLVLMLSKCSETNNLKMFQK